MTEPAPARVAQCPGCGAELPFKVGSSRVVVCGYCAYAVARTDRGLESLGKIADLVPTGSRLALGARGRFDGSRFTLVGRLQLEWTQGVWDEWVAAFEDGRWGWIAEAAGHYYASFKISKRPVPPFAALRPGQRLHLAGYGQLVVSDLKEAKVVAARGELPEVARPGDVAATADLSGKGGLFATLDYSDDPNEPAIFAGREATFEELEIDAAGAQPSEAKKVGAEKITCPQCSAPLALQAPDQTVRVTCRHCNSLLDASRGTLRHLAAVEPRELVIPLGTKATFGGAQLLVIGWMERACTVEGIEYRWEEWLLYDERDATYRFLVCSDGHWSLVAPIGVGDVGGGEGGALRFQDRTFKKFSSVDATVTAVLGEFYWAVEVGEKGLAVDYIRPPESISIEWGGGEKNCSRAVYLTPEEVFAAVRTKPAGPAPRGVGMMQKNPHEETLKRSWRWGLSSAAAAVAVFLMTAMGTVRQLAYQGTFPTGALPVPSAEPGAASGPQSHPATASEPWEGIASFTEPFTVDRSRQNLEIAVDSNVNQSWAFASGALVNEETGEAQEFNLSSSFYSGSDSDGAWSEDDRRNEVFLSSTPAGRYLMRVEVGWEPNKPTPSVELKVTSGVPRVLHLFLALLPILGFPAFVLWRRAAFEKARWEESNVVVRADDD